MAQDEQRNDENGTISKSRSYITRKELIAQTGLSASTIQRYKESDKIPFFQPGGPGARVLFLPNAIEAAVRQSEQDKQATTCIAGQAEHTAGQTGEKPSQRKLSGPRPRWQTRQAGAKE